MCDSYHRQIRGGNGRSGQRGSVMCCAEDASPSWDEHDLHSRTACEEVSTFIAPRRRVFSPLLWLFKEGLHYLPPPSFGRGRDTAFSFFFGRGAASSAPGGEGHGAPRCRVRTLHLARRLPANVLDRPRKVRVRPGVSGGH